GSSRSAAPSRKRMRAQSPGTATRAGREVAGESEIGGEIFLAIAMAGHRVPCHPSRAAAPIAGGSGARIGAGPVRVWGAGEVHRVETIWGPPWFRMAAGL